MEDAKQNHLHLRSQTTFVP